jgi:hypothetical protein
MEASKYPLVVPQQATSSFPTKTTAVDIAGEPTRALISPTFPCRDYLPAEALTGDERFFRANLMGVPERPPTLSKMRQVDVARQC